MADIAGKEVVEERRLPVRLERRERRCPKMGALLGAARRAEQRRERGGGSGGHQDLAELPGTGLARHPIEPLGKLPIALPDQFGVPWVAKMRRRSPSSRSMSASAPCKAMDKLMSP